MKIELKQLLPKPCTRQAFSSVPPSGWLPTHPSCSCLQIPSPPPGNPSFLTTSCSIWYVTTVWGVLYKQPHPLTIRAYKLFAQLWHTGALQMPQKSPPQSPHPSLDLQATSDLLSVLQRSGSSGYESQTFLGTLLDLTKCTFISPSEARGGRRKRSFLRKREERTWAGQFLSPPFFDQPSEISVKCRIVIKNVTVYNILQI